MKLADALMLALVVVVALIGVGFLWLQNERLQLDRQRAVLDCEMRGVALHGDVQKVIAMCEQRFQTTIPRS